MVDFPQVKRACAFHWTKREYFRLRKSTENDTLQPSPVSCVTKESAGDTVFAFRCCEGMFQVNTGKLSVWWARCGAE